MTSPPMSPSASRTGTLPTLRNGIVLFILLLSLLSSAITLVREWGSGTREQALMGSLPALRALLFQKGTQLHLYDTSLPASIVRSAQVSERTMTPRLLSPRAVLVGSDNAVRVRDMASSYSYDPLAADKKSPLVSLSRNTNFTYFLSDQSGRTHVHIDFAGCGEIADIPLPAEESWYDAKKVFGALNLPMQQKMLLSPAETSLALVKHDTFPRIALVQLIERRASELTVPSFDPEQLHFSPFFIDEETLLFSVLDSKHWATVRYHLLTGTYEILSENFTDHAYHSLTGNIILQQSFLAGETNIPFGSVGLLEQRKSISVRSIETIPGPRENNAAIFSLLFQKPKESILRFKPDLTTQSFNAIPESDLRESLRAFWRDYQLKMTQAVGVFRLLELNADDTLRQIKTIPFEIQPPATFVQYVRDAEPLLNALELPATLVGEYRKRSADAAKAGEEYLLVDDLSY